jgi:hypothetical protein
MEKGRDLVNVHVAKIFKRVDVHVFDEIRVPKKLNPFLPRVHVAKPMFLFA